MSTINLAKAFKRLGPFNPRPEQPNNWRAGIYWLVNPDIAWLYALSNHDNGFAVLPYEPWGYEFNSLIAPKAVVALVCPPFYLLDVGERALIAAYGSAATQRLTTAKAQRQFPGRLRWFAVHRDQYPSQRKPL